MLTQQGVFAVAMRVLQAIGPAFYGLRTSVVFLLLMLVLNLSRLQHVMQREPGQMGRIVGLDRAPELKTIRRKLRLLAGQQRSLELMEGLAGRVDEHGRVLPDDDEARFGKAGKRLCADIDGWSLHAAVTVHADDDQGRENLCRYVLRRATGGWPTASSTLAAKGPTC